MRTKTDSLLKLMKISITQILILIVSMGALQATNLKGQGVLDAVITLKLDNENLKTALVMIEQTTKVRFVYNHKEIPTNHKVSLDVKNQRLADVLSKLFKPLSIAYEADDEQIILSRSKNTSFSTPSVSDKKKEEDYLVPPARISHFRRSDR